MAGWLDSYKGKKYQKGGAVSPEEVPTRQYIPPIQGPGYTDQILGSGKPWEGKPMYLPQGQYTPETVKTAAPRRSTINKVGMIARNPMTALQYKAQGQDIPDYLEYGDRNKYDMALDVLNPLTYTDAIGRTVTAQNFRDPNQSFGEALGKTALDIATVAAPVEGIMRSGPKFGTKSVKNPMGNRAVINEHVNNRIVAEQYSPEMQAATWNVGPFGARRLSPQFNQHWQQWNDLLARRYDYIPRNKINIPTVSFNPSSTVMPFIPGQDRTPTIQTNQITPEQQSGVPFYPNREQPTSIPPQVKKNTQRNKQEKQVYIEPVPVEQPTVQVQYLHSHNGQEPILDSAKQYQKYQQGGAVSPEDAAISNVLMNRNRGKNFVDRAYHAGNIQQGDSRRDLPNSTSPLAAYPRLDDPDNFGGYQSHRMSYSTGEEYAPDKYTGPYRVFPDIVQDKTGRLQNLGRGAEDYANRTGQYIEAPTQHIADMLSEYGYKKATGIPIHQQGGKVSTTGYKKDSVDRHEPFLQIPSSNITMRGVPHRVLGIDNTGKQILMVPGQDYQFPGTQVMEYPIRNKMQNGGALPKAQMGAYITHNPNDPRIQAYADSNLLYNIGQTNLENLNKSSNYDEFIKTTGTFHTPDAQAAIKRLTQYNGKPYTADHQVHRKFNFFDTGTVDVTKKPQPVIYQEPVKPQDFDTNPVYRLSQKPVQKKPLPKDNIQRLSQSQLQQLPTGIQYTPKDIPNSYITESTDWYSPDVQGEQYIPAGFRTTQRMNMPQYKDGGWLGKYQAGGSIGYTNMNTRVQPTVNAPVVPAPTTGEQWYKDHPQQHVGPAPTYNTPGEQQSHEYMRNKMYNQADEERANREFASKLKAPSELIEKIIDAGTLAEGAGMVGKLGKMGIEAVYNEVNPGLQYINSRYSPTNIARRLSPEYKAATQSQLDKGHQWLKDWYNDPIIQQRMKDSKAYETFDNVAKGNYTSKFANPVVDIVNTLHKDNYGVYYPSTGESFVDRYPYPEYTIKAIPNSGGKVQESRQFLPNNIKSTTIHEGTHKLTNSNFGLWQAGKENLNKELFPNLVDTKGADPQGHLNLKYFTDPTEIHARVNELRAHYNLKPSDIITESKANQIIDDIQGGKTPLDRRFGDYISRFSNNDKYGADNLANVFNKMFGVAAPVGIGTAALQDKKQLGGKVKNNWLDKY